MQEAHLVAVYFVRHVYGQEVDVLWNQWDAYAFAISRIGLGYADDSDRQALRLAASGFWKKVGGRRDAEVRRNASLPEWEDVLTIGTIEDNPGQEERVEYRRITVTVSDSAEVGIKNEQLLGIARVNYERRRLELVNTP
jgi:hypothetical protein